MNAKRQLILAFALAAAGATGASEPPAADQVFKAKAQIIGPHETEITITVEKGYAIYRDRFKVSAAGNEVNPVIVGMPEGTDEKLHKKVAMRVRTDVPASSASWNLTIQGCSEAGFCYPPQEHHVKNGQIVMGSCAGLLAKLTGGAFC